MKARVELAIQKMTAEVKSRGCMDVLKWWLFMATDIIGELSFGDSFRMLEIGKVSCRTLNYSVSSKSCNRADKPIRKINTLKISAK